MFDHASINRAYRLVWSDRLNAYVAAAETARGRGLRAIRGVATLLLAALGTIGHVGAQTVAPPASTQLPTGGSVVAGQAAIGHSGARLDINQTSNRAAIDWRTFNIGPNAQVNFNQPSAQAVTLNRVLDAQPSQIYGRMTSNGQVFLTNPNGVYFSPSARVDVGGLVASTHGMSVADFMAGKNTFQRNGATGAVVNQGSLQAALGGYVALLAPEVRNEGVVLAQAGTVALAAGEAITLHFNGANSLAGIAVTPSQISALVENRHAVLAPGGLIILSAQAADRLQGGVVNNSGRVEAGSLTQRGGRIVLEATNRIENRGVLDASGAQGGDIALKADYDADVRGSLRATASNGSGGNITIESNFVRLAAESTIDARGAMGGGTVLIGGDWQGGGAMRQAQQVVMENAAVIDVSATRTGDGGKAVLWSDITRRDGATQFDGRIYALGAGGGQGGRVETSGHKLSVRGSVTAGKGGLWLLDPYDVVIANASSSNVDGAFNATGSPAVVDASAIANALTAGSDVTVYTGNTGNEAGNITLDTNIVPGAMANDATLTLKAHNSIFVNFRNVIDATQSGNTNRLNVVLWANAAGAGQGRIEMGSSTGIYSNGGNITLGGGSDIATGYAIGTGVGDAGRGIWLRDGTMLDAGGGNITLRGRASDGMAIAIGDPGGFGAGGSTLLTRDAGSIVLQGVATIGSGVHSPTGIYLHDDVRIQTADGAIILSGVGGNSSVPSMDNSGIALHLGGRILSESGTITLEGTRGAAGGGSGSGVRFHSGTKYVGHDDGTHIGRSSGNIILSADSIGWDGGTTNINTSGALAIQPRATSFSSPFTWSGNLVGGNLVGSGSINGFVINNFESLAGLTLGKAGNLAGITIASPVTMSGALNLFGGDIQVNSPITLNGSAMSVTNSGVFTTADGRDIRADGGFTQNGSGASSLGGEIRTDNAPIRFAGDLTVRDQVRLRSDGGDITLDGAVSGHAPGASHRLKLESGSGSITLNGQISDLERLTLTSSGMVTQTAPIRVADLLLDGTGDHFLTHDHNRINTLAANVGSGAVIIKNDAPLTIGTVSGVSGVTSSNGTVQIETTAGHALTLNQPVLAAAPTLLAGGDLTLAATVTATVGDLLLSTGGAFVNHAGANALATSGRWLVYSASPHANTFGGLASGNTGLFGKTFASYGPADVATDGYSGNRYVFANTENITVTTSGASIVYGNTPLLLANLYQIAPPSTFGGAILAPTIGGSPLIASIGATSTAPAGSYAITADVSGMTANAPGYNFIANNQGALTVTPRPVTLSGGRVYDATTNIAAHGLTLGNLVNGDSVNLTGNGVLSGKDVGAQTLAGSGSLALSNGNYTLSGASGSFNITPATLPVGGVVAQNKVYDAGVQASLAGTPTINALGADVVSVTGAAVAQFGDKNVGNAKPVTVSGFTLSGADAGNYVLQQPAGLSANITPATLAVNGVAAQNKVYDGNAQATLTGTPAVQALGSDLVSVGGSALAQFADANIGNNKPVTVSGYALLGADAGNYVLQQPAGLRAHISAPAVTSTPVPAPATPITPNPPVLESTTNYAAWLAPTRGGTLDVSAAFNAGGSITLAHGPITPFVPFLGAVPVLTAQVEPGQPNELSFVLPQALRDLLDNAGLLPVSVSRTDASPLPGWLRFDRWGKRLVAAAIPPNALPMSVLITLGTHKAVVKIDKPAATRMVVANAAGE